eukprot:scaffold2789_cov108-Isochrysis_galbana.AAC.4
MAARALPMRLVCPWRRLLDHSDCWVAQTNGRASRRLSSRYVHRYDGSRLAHALRSRSAGRPGSLVLRGRNILTTAAQGRTNTRVLGHFFTGTAAPCALSHRPAMAAAASRHHRCSGHLPGTREDSRGKGGGLSHCRPISICHEVVPPASRRIVYI